jgi:hypothetical protein
MPAVESRRRNSFLGSLALFTGLPALALAWFDFGGLPKVPVGPFELGFVEAMSAAALLLAILSLVLASSSKRTGTEIPLVAVLVCGGALGLAHFRHKLTPAAPPQAAPAQAAAVQGVAAPAIPGAKKMDPNHPPPATAHAVNTAKTTVQSGAAALQQQQQQQARAALRDARARYDAARSAIIQSLQSDATYQNAKADADTADAQLKQARATLPPGHLDLVKISESALQARDRLNQLIETAMLKDPASREAQAQLNAALEAVKH